MPISSIIFSKNRPLQLDLCLRSLPNLDMDYVPTVIYDCDEEYNEAYETLKQEHEGVEFWKQGKSLFRDVLNRIVTSNCDWTFFLTDDCIVYQKTAILSDVVLAEIFKDPLASSFSLRLGLNTNKRAYLLGDNKIKMIDDPLRRFEWQVVYRNNRGMVCYDRTQHLYGGYWNYPFSVDGHIYRTKDLLGWVDEVCYIEPIKKWKQTPNEFERSLQRFVQELPPFVIMNESSSVVNSPNNRVQDTITNINGHDFAFNAKDLLKMYNTGHRISPEKIDFSEVFCAHMELNILEGLE